MTSRKSILLVSTTLSACALAAPAAAQSGPAFTASVRFDAMRRVTGTIAPDPDEANGGRGFAAVRNSYDAAGRLTRVEKGELAAWQAETVAPAGWHDFTVLQVIEMGYDAAGRKVKEMLSSGGTVQSVTQYQYDADNRLVCTAVRMNAGTFPGPDWAGGDLPASACDPVQEWEVASNYVPDRIVRHVYDAANQLVQVREGVGTPDEAAEATYSYTGNGKRRFVIDAKGNKAELRYDGHDRLSRWVFPDAAGPAAFNADTPAYALRSAGALNEADYEEYGFDAGGNRTSLRTRAGETIGFGYDALNRMTAKDLPGSEPDVAYGYDLRGLQKSAADSNGDAVSSTYDNAGRLLSTTSTRGGAGRTLSYSYDANGNRQTMSWPDAALVVAYDHDGLDRVKAMRDVTGGGNSLLASFSFDALGRRESLTRGNGLVTRYGYDGASRLETLEQQAGLGLTISLGYNKAGQITRRGASNDLFATLPGSAATTTYHANGLNQMTRVNGLVLPHDARGNMASDGASSFTWSSENRALSAARNGTTFTIGWDPLGRLAASSGWNGYRFTHDGERMVQEESQFGTFRYVFGPGVDEPLVSITGTARSWLHADERGSVIAVSDAAGQVTARIRYDEYGRSNAASSSRFLYTGQMLIPEMGYGILHYKARMYHPALGRFLQRDPIGYDDRINLYAYVGNDSINNVDSTGKWSMKAHNIILQISVGDKVTARAMLSMQLISLRQDLPVIGNGKYNRMHYLRDPGQDPNQARRATEAYISRQTEIAKRSYIRGDEARALAAFTKAAHAIADSHSPAHRAKNGDPKAYDPEWGPADAAEHGHSPSEKHGIENYNELITGDELRPILKEIGKLWSDIFGKETGAILVQCTGSRILRDRC